ncbi:hypothetical protein M0R89_20025 (plasmid) [Halorussus limi]|uniref:DUF7344 domain-containing protein n=1 Tax=Halorussus limi TaxID=2938695 RepID=A0A8U0HZ60_9EURY|nr:hypothetical protein [Halorussus limi]UPV76452.1 hypothetical protein M0R89_20025 [Halorussus limi]
MSDDSDSVDRSMSLLASKERREVIGYFDRNDVESATIEVLTDHLEGTKVETDGGTPSTRAAKAKLHHVHLPKLEAHGVVEYDARSGEVRYRPDERVEAILEFTSEL